jgi:hypothetical protein
MQSGSPGRNAAFLQQPTATCRCSTGKVSSAWSGRCGLLWCALLSVHVWAEFGAEHFVSENAAACEALQGLYTMAGLGWVVFVTVPFAFRVSVSQQLLFVHLATSAACIRVMDTKLPGRCRTDKLHRYVGYMSKGVMTC